MIPLWQIPDTCEQGCGDAGTDASHIKVQVWYKTPAVTTNSSISVNHRQGSSGSDFNLAPGLFSLLALSRRSRRRWLHRGGRSVWQMEATGSAPNVSTDHEADLCNRVVCPLVPPFLGFFPLLWSGPASSLLLRRRATDLAAPIACASAAERRRQPGLSLRQPVVAYHNYEYDNQQDHHDPQQCGHRLVHRRPPLD